MVRLRKRRWLLASLVVTTLGLGALLLATEPQVPAAPRVTRPQEPGPERATAPLQPPPPPTVDVQAASAAAPTEELHLWQARLEQAKAEKARAEQARAEQVKAEQAKALAASAKSSGRSESSAAKYAAVIPVSEDERVWETIKGSCMESGFIAFVFRFPDSRYYPEAKQRLDELQMRKTCSWAQGQAQKPGRAAST